MADNPFHTPTPENLSSTDMVRLFVPEFKDFHEVQSAFHTIISGPRGTGKSTMLRYLQPDVQKLEGKCLFSQLKWIGVLVKLTGPSNLPEMKRLEKLMGHAFLMVTEHSLILEVLGAIIEMLRDHLDESERCVKLNHADKNAFSKVFTYSDEDMRSRIFAEDSADVNFIADCLDEFLQNKVRYLKQYTQNLVFNSDQAAFKGPLVSYTDFLYPLLKGIREFSWTPNAPIYLLFDDVDSLGKTAISIINSWISVRTTNEVCVKLATLQGRYPTFISSIGKRIEAPHDFYEFSVNEIYTTSFDTYQRRIEKIVDKRLADVSTARDFFPSDEKQDKNIDSIKKKYLSQDSSRGYRQADDAYRYAIADYIKELSAPAASGSGSKKQGSKFKYASFEWLVHISSGNTRDFLDAARKMYDKELEHCKSDAGPKFISSCVQDECVRNFSKDFLQSDFSKLLQELENLSIQDEIVESAETPENASEQLNQLGNLIKALGGIFRLQLMSDFSERRIFSFAFTDGPSKDVQAVLDIGVTYGYLQASTIGNKEGTGRVPLYILSRRLAPYFGLDPTGFAGYKFMKNSVVREALTDPKSVINKVHRKFKSDKTSSLEDVLEPQQPEPQQRNLFDDC